MMKAAPTRTCVAVAPPRYPVSRIAPSTAVCGMRYRTVQTTSTTPRPRARFSSQPNLVKPSAKPVGFTNFMTALITSISTGRMLSTQPVQYAAFETGAVSVAIPMIGPSPGSLGRTVLRRRLRHRLHRRQPLLEVAAHHLVHVHEQADRLADEVLVAGHAPVHHGLVALGLEGEFREAGVLERPDEVQVDADQLGRPALGDGHAALADLVVAGPGEDGSGA